MIALNFMPQLIALNEISFSFTLISFVLHKHNSYSKAFIKAILCAVIVSLFQFNYVSFACIISYLLKYYGQLASIDTTSLLGILVSYLGLD
jgi:hypothetical protein